MIKEAFDYDGFQYEISEESSMETYKNVLAQLLSLDKQRVKSTLVLKLKTRKKIA